MGIAAPPSEIWTKGVQQLKKEAEYCDDFLYISCYFFICHTERTAH